MSGTFPPEVIAAAQKSQKAWGCPASVCLAQWALESAWGAHMSGKNNPFGIKAATGQGGTERMTWEVVNGARVNMQQRFRDFASLDEAFDQHGRLLATGSAYASARVCRTNPIAYAHALTGHYATDPQYGAKLISIMNAHDLYQYDADHAPIPREPPVAPIPPKTAPSKAKTAAVIVAGTGAVAAATAPQGHWLVWTGVCVVIIAVAVLACLHWKK